MPHGADSPGWSAPTALDFTRDDALSLSRAADEVLVARLVQAGRRASGPPTGPPVTAVISGSGEFLARRVSRILLPDATILSLGDLWGIDDSEAALQVPEPWPSSPSIIVKTPLILL